MKVSVVISARNEWPNIVHTVHGILNDLSSFLTWRDFEIIIVDNGSVDNTSSPNIVGTSDFLRMRGIFHDRVVKIVHDPVMGNVSARNKGAAVATGEYLFFSDAHMAYKPGSFKAMIDAIDASGGIVHPAVDWMGAYPAEPNYQYSIKLGEKMWGTWARNKVADTWFYIPMSGHCCLGMKRQQFLDFGGYNPFFRCYGGGEFYLDMKWWMLGSNVVCEPNALAWHLSAGRGYAYMHDDLVHNMMLCAYALADEPWSERLLVTYLNKTGANPAVVYRLYREALEEGAADRAFVKNNAVMSFEDVLDRIPWDEKNKERHGHAMSGMLIYEDWVNQLRQQEAKDLYENSKMQKDLSARIRERWGKFVYAGKG